MNTGQSLRSKSRSRSGRGVLSFISTDRRSLDTVFDTTQECKRNLIAKQLLPDLVNNFL